MRCSILGFVVHSNLLSEKTTTASSRSPRAARSLRYMLLSEVGKQSSGLPR